MKKRIISAVMAISLLFGTAAALPESVVTDSIGITASAVRVATSGKCGENVTWSLENGVLTISGTGEMEYYFNSPFKNRTEIETVVIKTGVTSVGARVFEDCTNITNITIPSSVSSIGRNAFSGTKWLENQQKKNPLVVVNGILFDGKTCSGNVTIPKNVKYIAECAFQGCTSITRVTIPSTVTGIGDYAFESCKSITDLTISNGVSCIGYESFLYCESLTNVAILESVTNIGGCAFDETIWLKNQQKKNPFVIVNGILINAKKCTNNVIIPNNVKSIGDRAFFDCASIKSVVIPSSVTRIGDHAFVDCSRLTSVNMQKGVTSIDDYAFLDCPNLTSVTIPDSVISIGNSVFSMCSGLTSITIPNSVKSLGSGVFSQCTNLKSVSLPDCINSIGSHAFQSCTSLTSVTIPSGVTNIDSYMFYECGNLKSVTIPNTITSIGNYSFYNCGSLASVTIPNSVTSIGKYAFFGCTSLKNVTIPGSVSNIDGGAFGYCYDEKLNDKKVESFLIKCEKGSAAEKYASNNGFSYKIITGIKITKQPTNVTVAKAGDTATFSVTATGKGLKYEWYIKDVGGDWKKTGAVTNQYDINLTTARNGRQVFCKVIDANGKSVRSNIAVGSIAGTVIVVEQPKDVTVSKAGDTAVFTVKGAGRTLKYEWYIKDPGGDWKKTGAVTNQYDIPITAARNGRQVFCKIIDFKGRSVRTNVVKANIAGTVVIMEQPKNVTVAKAGDTATFTVKAVGHGMKYEWYIKDPGKTSWTKTGATSNKYSVSVTKARNGRQVFCKVIDFKNRSVRSNIVSAKIK